MSDPLLIFASLATALWGAGRSIRLVFAESATAKRELKRLPQVRIADLERGPACIVGRVIAAGPLLDAPLTGRPCAAHITTLSWIASEPGRGSMMRLPATEQRFLVDDGSGRAVVVIPPPPPEPLPGDDFDYEILCSFAGIRRERIGWAHRSPAVSQLMESWNLQRRGLGSVTATEGVLLPGDTVAIGGYATSTVDRTGASPPYRAPPTRALITATRYYPLLIVRR